MARLITLSSATAAAMLNAGVDRIGTAGFCRFYTTGSTQVVACLFNASAFSTASSNRATMRTASAVTGTATGPGLTITHWHMTTSANSTAIISGTAGISTGDFDIEFTSPTISSGETVTLTSFYFDLPLTSA